MNISEKKKSQNLRGNPSQSQAIPSLPGHCAMVLSRFPMILSGFPLISDHLDLGRLQPPALPRPAVRSDPEGENAESAPVEEAGSPPICRLQSLERRLPDFNSGFRGFGDRMGPRECLQSIGRARIRSGEVANEDSKICHFRSKSARSWIPALASRGASHASAEVNHHRYVPI